MPVNTYDRMKHALEAILRCETIEQAHSMATLGLYRKGRRLRYCEVCGIKLTPAVRAGKHSKICTECVEERRGRLHSDSLWRGYRITWDVYSGVPVKEIASREGVGVSRIHQIRLITERRIAFAARYPRGVRIPDCWTQDQVSIARRLIDAVVEKGKKGVSDAA